MERHFSFLFLTLFIFAYSYQLTYGNDYEFVTRCTRSRKKSAELNLLITITCNNTKKNSDLFFYEIFPLFSSSKKCQIIFLLPEKKKLCEGKIFYQHEGHRFPLNADTILSSLLALSVYFSSSLSRFKHTPLLLFVRFFFHIATHFIDFF